MYNYISTEVSLAVLKPAGKAKPGFTTGHTHICNIYWLFGL